VGRRALPLLATALLLGAAPVGRSDVVLLAISKTEHKLAIVDPRDGRVLARVPVGPDPHEVVAPADGRTAYVSNTGGGQFHEIDVIDLASAAARPPIDTGALTGPHGLALVDGKLWFTAQGAKAIARYDPATGRIDRVVGTGQDQTHMLAVTADQKRVFASNVQSGTISILDEELLPPIVTPIGYVLPTAKPYLDWRQTVVPFAKGNEGIALSPDGAELWAATPFGGAIAVLDTRTRRIAARIPAAVVGANRMAFTPDGRRLLVSSLKTGELTIVDAKRRAVIGRVALGHGAAGTVISADGTRAYVSCTPDAYVAVVDLRLAKVIAHIDIGGRPDGVALATAVGSADGH